MATLSRLGFAAAAAAALILSAPSADADPVAEFYKGRTLTILLGTGPGRTYDLYARMLANHMPRHIPGNPKAIVQYMPGAGGLNATNYLYNAAPRDGTVIANLFSTLPSLRLFQPETAKYDPLKFSWLGAFSSEVNVVIVNRDAPAATFAEAKTEEVVIGSIGRGNTTYQFPALINGTFGTRFKIISGYESGGAIYKAMDGREVHGYAPVWLSVVATRSAELERGDIRVLVQGGLSKLPELPDVPLLLDFAETDEQRSMIRFLAAAAPLARAAQGPPDIPTERYEALVRALARTVDDPAYLAEAEKLKLTVGFTSRDETVAAVRQIMETPPPVIAKLREVLGY